MNKVLVALVCVFFALTASAFAAGSDSVTVKVKILSSLSVDITESALDLGSVNVGSTTVSGSGVTVTNTGSGVAETYSLSLSNPSGWTAGQAAGANAYVLNAAFDADGSAISWSAANDALTTTATTASATKFASDQTGLSVPQGAVRKLWFQFLAPTATDITTGQDITVTITAAAG
jgi:hypothetical protein